MIAGESGDTASTRLASRAPRPPAAGKSLRRGPLEKTHLEIRFIPVRCSAPLVYAHTHGFFERNGLRVNLGTAPGWSGIKGLMVHGKVDAVHMLSPMPLACSLGLDGPKVDIRLLAMQNVNGQALTLSNRHRGIESAADMAGLVFGVPYRFSMHYYLLCHLLACHGIDPMRDVEIREIAPPRMPYYLEKGWVDGVLAPEPFNQIPVRRGTGFIYELSKHIWGGHPCCGFATSREFQERHPNTCRAMLKSVIEAELALHRADKRSRVAIAREISDPAHLGQPDPLPVEQVLTGVFPDGKGGEHNVPDRIDFRPYPWPEYGSWILSQMQRWGQLAGDVDYERVAGEVFRFDDARELAREVGFDEEAGPALEGVAPFTGQDPQAYMSAQPFCVWEAQKTRAPRREVSEPASRRLGEIAAYLADVAGGRLDVRLEGTGDDEVALVEQAINEVVLNARFAAEALAEQRDDLASTNARLLEEVEQRAAAERRLRDHQQRLEETVAERTATIQRQAREILELSTPVLQVREGVVVAPLIGSLDSDRTQQFMERLLEAIVTDRAAVALVDITGVPVVDTHTAQHLLETVTAARLLGAEVVLTGVRPAIAQSLVHLGVDLSGVITRSSLAAGLEVAFGKLGVCLSRTGDARAGEAGL